MKKVFKLVIAAVIVLGAQFSHASVGHPAVKVRVLDATSFALYMEQIDNQKLSIKIEDESGQILYKKTVRNKNEFQSKVNLKELPEGNYKLEIEDKMGKLSYPILLTANAVEISNDTRIATYNPIFRQKNNNLSLVMFSPSQEVHNLNIYNDENELVHSEEISETVNYSVVINCSDHVYTYTMPVK